MAVLEAGGLEEGDLGHMAGIGRVEEIVQIVLVIRRVGVSDRADTARAGVVGIARIDEVLKRLVMRDVIDLGYAGNFRPGRAGAAGRAVGVGNREIEAA